MHTFICLSCPPIAVLRYGDLHGLLLACKSKKVKVSHSEQLSWGVQLASALGYLAKKRFVHLDVAARNVFVDAGHRLRLGDFGCSMPYEAGKSYYLMRNSTRLSIRWLAVEVCGPPPKLISEASDVWSYGVTLWEIMTYARRRPYHRHGLKDVARLVSRGGRLAKPSRCPAPIWAVMERTWLADPTTRPTFHQIVKDLTALMVADGGEIRDVAKLVNEALDAEAKTPDAVEAGDTDATEEPEEPEAHDGSAEAAGSLAALGDGGRESVALNKTEWDELTALLDAFDN
jgi:serine/threonine protein kinase